jgi:ParB family transcriptional regulator, chromosome partitioning protein
MRSALGKGLSALISEETVASVTAATPRTVAPTNTIPLTQIVPDPAQPRRHFAPEALQELADSIRQKGILQPVLVTPTSDGKYMLIAGERRWRASQLAGLSEIPAVVKTVSDAERFQLALIENIQREDLNAIEQAQGYVRLMEEFQMTQEAVAQVVGKDRAVVANTVRLLQLPEDMRDALVAGKISAGHARALVGLTDSAARADLFQRILSEQLTVRAVENAVREQKDVQVKGHVRHPAGESKPAEVRAMEEDLQHALARKVEFQISGADAQKGWLRLEFYSLDDLDALIRQLKNSKATTNA